MNTVKYWILALTVLLLASCVQEVMVQEDVALPIAGKWAMVDDDMLTSEYIVFDKGEFTCFKTNTPRFVHNGFIVHSKKADFTQSEKARYSIESGRIIINDKFYAISVKDDILIFDGNKYVRFKDMDPNRYFSIGIASDDKYIKFGYAKTTDTLLVVVKNESPKYKLSATTEASWINDIKYSEGNLSFTIDKSTEDRSSTILLQYFDAEDVVINVTQAVDRFIVLDQKNVTLAYNSQDYTLLYSITNPIEDALPSVATTAEWIKDITVSGTNVSFHVTENPGSAPRTATLYFDYDEAHSVEFTLSQQAAVTDFTVTQTDLDIDYHGGQLSFGYNISNPRDGLTLSVLSVNDWIQVVSTDNNVVKLNVAENNSSGTRMGYITASYGSWVNKVNITQSHSAVKLVASNTVVNYAGGEATIPVTIDNPRAEGVLTAVSSQAWVSSIAVSDNNVSCNIAANTTGADREATITMTYKVGNSVMATKEITVSQPAPVLIVDKETLKYAYLASYQKLTITSNCEWNVSSSKDWLILGQSSSSGSGFVNIAATANTTGIDRTATITVSNATYNISRAISVSQVAPYIKLSESTLTPNYGTESMSVNVDANVAWTATASDWITVTPTSGSSSGTIRITPTKNESTSPRIGTVTVAAASFSISSSITVQQRAFNPSWSIDNSSDWDISSPSASSTKRVIRTNLPITLSSSAEWLTVSQNVVEQGETEITLYASDNNYGATRNATLTLLNASNDELLSFSVSQVAPSYSVSFDSWDVGSPLAGSTMLTIDTDIPLYVTSSDGWLTASHSTVSQGQTIITLNASDNNSGASRNATLTVANPAYNASKTITVTQNAPSYTIPLSSWTVKTPLAQSNTLTINTNIPFNIRSSGDWLSASHSEIQPGETTITLYLQDNTSGVKRTGTFTISNPGCNETRTINVSQDGPSVSISSTSWDITTADASSTTVNINSNIPLSVVSEYAWLTADVSSVPAGNSTLTLNVSANPYSAMRGGTLDFNNDTFGVSRSINVQQMHLLLIASKTSWDIESAANSTTVDIESTASWTVTTDVSWLTVSTTSGTGDGSFTISATANESGEESRTGTVTVSNPASGVSRVITVNQSAAPAYLTIGSTSWSPNYEEQTSSSITVTSNISWTVTKDVSWLTVSSDSGSGDGSFTISATANESASDSRIGTVTISNTSIGLSRTITVTQGEAPPSLSISSTSWNPDAEEQTSSSFTITSNISWTISKDVPWLSVSTASGSGNGSFTISATANESMYDSRTGTVTVSNTSYGLSRTITVTQNKLIPSLSISATSWNPTYALQTSSSFSVTSNVSWTVTKDAGWISVSTNSGTGNGSFTITVTANQSTSDSRTGTVTVSNTTFGLSRTLTVTQDKTPVITISSTSWSPTLTAQTSSSFTVTSNVNWTASSSASWLTLSKSSGSSGDTSMTLTVTANTSSTSSRTATVTISDATNSVSKTITVTQAGLPALKLNGSGSYAWAKSGTNTIQSTNYHVKSTTSSSTITFTTTSSTTLSFNYKVSSESGYDKLTISVDGSTPVNAISGTSSSSYSTTLSAGSHTISLSYRKDGSVDSNDDRGYISNITLYDHTYTNSEIQ